MMSPAGDQSMAGSQHEPGKVPALTKVAPPSVEATMRWPGPPFEPSTMMFGLLGWYSIAVSLSLVVPSNGPSPRTGAAFGNGSVAYSTGGGGLAGSGCV